MKRFALVVLVLTLGCGAKKETEREAGSDRGTGAGAGTGRDDSLVKRGEYVANVAGCTVCHMAFGPQGPDPSRSLSGGLEVPDVIGTWRAPNITQDRATGIGAWTDAQIIAAIREGTKPDGSQMFPIMPFPSFNRMTDDDVKAVVAFLRTLPAIEHAVPPNDLKIPRMAVDKPANAPDPTGDPVKHGEYLASLMHCASCHTPIGLRGPDLTKVDGGGMPFTFPMLGEGTLYSANITSDPETGIGTWTEQNIIDAVTKLTKPDGSPVQGPMQFYVAAWSGLSDADARALAAYVKTIPAVKNKVPPSTFKPHAPGGPGAGGPPPAGAGKPG